MKSHMAILHRSGQVAPRLRPHLALLLLSLALPACESADRERADPRAAPVLSDHGSRLFEAHRNNAASITNKGGRATACTVTPALSEGLSLAVDSGHLLPNSCVIFGRPPGPSDAVSYTVTASNVQGSSSATVEIRVHHPRPRFVNAEGHQLMYNQDLTVGESVELQVINRGGRIIEDNACSVRPQLPQGLTASTSDVSGCQITGTPTAASEAATYTVVGATAGGIDMAFVTLSTTMPAAPEADMVIWRDEFEGASLDTDKWDIQTGTGCPDLCGGWGNNELQSYSSQNISVNNGNLAITATDRPDSSSPYGSARIRTAGKRSFTYPHGGALRIEARMQLPAGQGLWPAFWMLAEDQDNSDSPAYGTWPLSGEIDIVEAVNLGTNKTRDNPIGRSETTGTTHFGMLSPLNTFAGSATLHSFDLTGTFNVYAVEWQAGEIRWYLNSRHLYTQTSKTWYTLSERNEVHRVLKGGAPFDQAFHLLLNLAVGGNLPGSPDSTTAFPQSMLVDYVRVTSCARDPANSQSCYAKDDEVAPDSASIFPAPGAEATAHISSLGIFGEAYEVFEVKDDAGTVTDSATFEAVASSASSAIVAGNSGGQAVEISYTASGGSVAFEGRKGSDSRNFELGGANNAQVVFDLTVKQLAGDASGLEFRMLDSAGGFHSHALGNDVLKAIMGQSNNTGRVAITLRGASIDFSSIATPFSLGSTGSFDASGQIVVQVDNVHIRFVCPGPQPGGGVPATRPGLCGPSLVSSGS